MRELNEKPAPREGAGLEPNEPAVEVQPPKNYPEGTSAASLLRVEAAFCFQPRPSVAIGSAISSFLALNAKRDVYFLLGEPKHHLSKKPRKDDMVGSRRLWVDLDPPPSVWNKDAKSETTPGALATWRDETLARLQAFEPAPSFVIDSGRGYWGLWQLKELAGQDEVEAANLALAHAFGDDGDSCHNIDRVARMPDTFNTKTGAVARLVVIEPDRLYSIDQFQKAEPPGPPRPTSPAAATVSAPIIPRPVDDLRALDDFKVPTKTRSIITHGHDPEQPARFPSRSQALFFVCCDLCRHQVPDEVILGIILDERFGISDSIYRKADGSALQDPQDYAERQVLRARERVAEARAAIPDQFAVDEKGKIAKTQGNIRLAMQLGRCVPRSVRSLWLHARRMCMHLRRGRSSFSFFSNLQERGNGRNGCNRPPAADI